MGGMRCCFFMWSRRVNRSSGLFPVAGSNPASHLKTRRDGNCGKRLESMSSGSGPAFGREI